MTDRAHWSDPDRVDRWVAKDARRQVVQQARELAASLVALETTPELVVEVAAGAGSFLAAFLRTFPDARGVWSDGSAEMARHARTTLAQFGDRVEYRPADMRTPGLVPDGAADVVVCARATHGLSPQELAPFYRGVAGMLRPGGWLVNLDHMAGADPWTRRYDQLTPRFYDGTPDAPASGPKERGSHTLADHLDALASVGLVESDTPWRLLSTVLVLARRAPDDARPT